MDDEKEDQSINQDNNLGDPQNSNKTSDKDTFISNNNKSKTRSAEKVISNNEDNNKELILDLEKVKWMLANNSLEAIELYFESLEF